MDHRVTEQQWEILVEGPELTPRGIEDRCWQSITFPRRNTGNSGELPTCLQRFYQTDQRCFAAVPDDAVEPGVTLEQPVTGKRGEAASGRDVPVVASPVEQFTEREGLEGGTPVEQGEADEFRWALQQRIGDRPDVREIVDHMALGGDAGPLQSRHEVGQPEVFVVGQPASDESYRRRQRFRHLISFGYEL